jgi:hypothetical protein
MQHDRLYLQIVNNRDAVVHVHGGVPLEREMIATITDSILERASTVFWDALSSGLRDDLVDGATKTIVAQGVGFFKTRKQVEKAIRSGMAESLDLALRAKRSQLALPAYVTHGELKRTIEAGIHDAIQTFKDETRFIMEK